MEEISTPVDTRPLWQRILYWSLFLFSSLVLAGAVILTAVVFLAVDWLLGVGLLVLTIIPATSTLFLYIGVFYRKPPVS